MKKTCSYFSKFSHLTKTLTVLLGLTASHAQAQLAANYGFSQSQGVYTALTGGTVLGTATNDEEVFNNSTTGSTGTAMNTGFPIGFNFTYNGQTFDHFAVATNGYIVLGTGSFPIQNTFSQAIANSATGSGFDQLIAGFHLDMEGQTGSELRYQTIGAAPNRKLVVQWSSYKVWGTTSPHDINFQIVLNESSNKVEVVYGTVFSLFDTFRVQVGLRGIGNADYSIRTTVNDWSLSTDAGSDTATMPFSSIDYPSSGWTYTWMPQSCPGPYNIAVSGTGTTSATATWTSPAPAPALGYTYEVRTAGQPGSGSTGLVANGVISNSATSHTLSSLPQGTGYYFYLRAICSAGDSSAWNSSPVFNTGCGAASLPFTENFDVYPAPCWEEAKGFLTSNSVLSGNSSAWSGDIYLNNPTGTNSAARIALFGLSPLSIPANWLISPSIDLGATPGDYVLEFNLGFVNAVNGTPQSLGPDDTMAVVLSTDNGATWSTADRLALWTATNTPLGTANGGTRLYLPLSNLSGQIKIGFYGSESTTSQTFNYTDAFVDSVRVSVCNKPLVSLGNDTTLCSGSNGLILSSGPPPSPAHTYEWSSGATTPTLNVNAAGTYWVKVGTGNPGCFATDTIHVSVAAAPLAGSIVTSGSSPSLAFSTSGSQNGTQYAWNFGDGTTGSGANASHTYTANGTYTVTLTVSNACGSATATKTVTVSGLAVGQTSALENELTLYPNPAKDVVNIESLSALKLQGISLFNATGAAVFRKELPAVSSLQVDVRHLPSGLYLLHIRTSKGVVVRKLRL